MRDHGVAGHLETTDFGPRAHSPENRKKSPCFFCAWHRRKRLFDICQTVQSDPPRPGAQHRRPGLHLLHEHARTGKVYGLVPKENYFGGRLTLIRPLLLLDKATITQACRQWKLPVWENDCPSKDKTARRQP
jgi:tRNA 2-thiocytidine biosynthesis protein TtcA